MSHNVQADRPLTIKATIDRACLAILVAVAAGTGFWAYFAPRFWYDAFPGFGLSWLPQLGPYNEHLAKDTGAMFLALAVLSLLALWRATDVLLVRIAGGTWLVFNVLHFVYHMTMLHMYTPRDQVLNVLTLGLLIIVSAALIVPTPRRPHADNS
ncbi:hypothetical protein [Saccharopolyspora sp. 5N708]|uniref:hypothetical protein n=1 Tax=Saccharopolyspora sp. 5N708 TaxID=3457424 RepID=UPI003FD3FCA5